MARGIEVMHEDRFTSMARQMTKWVDQVLGPTYHKYCPSETWTPSINFYEDEEQYCMVVELSGVDPAAVDLRVEGNLLMLRGHRATPGMEKVCGRLQLHHMEIDHGPFCRTIELPRDVKVDAIAEADYKNGFLYVRLPKTSR